MRYGGFNLHLGWRFAIHDYEFHYDIMIAKSFTNNSNVSI